MSKLNVLEGGILWEDVLAITTAEAQAMWVDWRVDNGLSAVATPFATAPDANSKLAKDHVGFLPWSLSLAQARTSGINVCPASTTGCRMPCVGGAGRGKMAPVIKARQVRTTFLFAHPAAFLRLLIDEIDRSVRKCDRLGVGCAWRLNAFSDIAWERVAPWLFEMFDMVTFYDYSKRTDRTPPVNMHITVSATERTVDADLPWMVDAANVAVVFHVKRLADLPATYMGVPVVDGDKSDLRFKDPSGVIVGLRAKGKLIAADRLGFGRRL